MSLLQTYKENIADKLTQEFELGNVMAAPKVVKVVVNMGIGEIRDSKEEQEKAVEELAKITGQKPSLRQAKKLSQALE